MKLGTHFYKNQVLNKIGSKWDIRFLRKTSFVVEIDFGVPRIDLNCNSTLEAVWFPRSVFRTGFDCICTSEPMSLSKIDFDYS